MFDGRENRCPAAAEKNGRAEKTYKLYERSASAVKSSLTRKLDARPLPLCKTQPPLPEHSREN